MQSDAPGSAPAGYACAPLSYYGVLSVAGDDARAFLHAQLTADVEHLGTGRGGIAGWCSAKGRLLANFLVVPAGDGFLLVLSRDLCAPVAKRLSMFVLRSKVRIADVSAEWTAYGLWGGEAATRLEKENLLPPDAPYALASAQDGIALRADGGRFLLLARGTDAPALVARLGGANADESAWRLLEIRSGRALINLATQDKFVPQMIYLEAAGGVDFKKGCYPGQEVVARAQYRGQLKRRMVRARVPAGVALQSGQDLYAGGVDDEGGGGTVLDVAPAGEGTELLAVVPLAALEHAGTLRARPDDTPLEILSLPYSA